MAATEFRVEDERFNPSEPPERRRSWLAGCMIGCLVVLGAVLVLGALAAWWLSRNWRGLSANVATKVVEEGIKSSELPAEEQAEIMVEVNRVADAFREGRLSKEQITAIMQKLDESPLVTMAIASAAEKQYLAKSGLSDEERAEARVTLRRFLRGSIDGKINEQSVDAALSHVATKTPEGQWEIREKVSDEELRAFLAEAKRAADEAEIPEQPEEFDPSDEVKRIIDEAMREPAEM
jgi:hypothetical protein